MSLEFDEEIQLLEKQIKRAKLQKELAGYEEEVPVAEVPVTEVPVAEVPVAEPKTVVWTETQWGVEEQHTPNDNRLITEEMISEMKAVSESLQQPHKGNKSQKSTPKKAVEEKAVEEKAVEEKAVEEKAVEEKAVRKETRYPHRPLAQIVRTNKFRDWGVLCQQYIKADHDDQKIMYNIGKAFKQYQKSGMNICKPPTLQQVVYMAYVNGWVNKKLTPTRYDLRKEHEKLLEGIGPSILHDPEVMGPALSKAMMKVSRMGWFTPDELLGYMQDNNIDCLERAWPVRQLSELLATHYKKEWASSWSEMVRRRLEVLEKDGFVVKKQIDQVPKRMAKMAKIPTEKEIKENNVQLPICMRFYNISGETYFWYLTKKGLKG